MANYFSDNISAYEIDAATGGLTAVAGSPFAAGLGPYAITVEPSGKFAYVANAGQRQRLALSHRPGHGRAGPLRRAGGARGDPPELRGGRSVGQVPLRGQ